MRAFGMCISFRIDRERNLKRLRRDVPNIRTLFPNRLPGAPDVLSSRFARITSVLVGYDVELKVDFASDLREEVNSIYEEVKNTGGRMSIFGFLLLFLRVSFNTFLQRSSQIGT